MSSKTPGFEWGEGTCRLRVTSGSVNRGRWKGQMAESLRRTEMFDVIRCNGAYT